MITEKEVFEIGSSILEKSRQSRFSFLKKNFWYKLMMNWTMKSPRLKTSLFRFIDVLPSFKTDKQFLDGFEEYFKDVELAGLAKGVGGLAPSLMAGMVKKNIEKAAKMFIAGRDIKEALPVLKENWDKGMAFSVDILGEAILSEKEADEYFNSCNELLDQLKKQNFSKNQILEEDKLGSIPVINLSVKASALYSQIKVEAWEDSKDKIKKRLRPLFERAVKEFFFINLDMETYEHKDLFLEVFKELIMEENLKDYPHFGVVVQAYLKESLEDLKDLGLFSQKRKTPFSVRLVKGAYWDSEFLLSGQKNWPCPVFTSKEETDLNFEKCLDFLFLKKSPIKLAVASHNVRSLAYALALHKKNPEVLLEFQVLYGMGDALFEYLKQSSYRVRVYLGVGELIPGMSYLARRLLENTANQSFIMKSFDEKKSSLELLKAPSSKEGEEIKIKEPEFLNHPVLDFSKKENRESFSLALKKVEKEFPFTVPLIIDGKERKTGQAFERENPSEISQILSKSFHASKEDGEEACEKASQYFKTWREISPEKRIACLRKLGDLLKEKDLELAALQVFEVGKTWSEAYSDVAEAIDFCFYYAKKYEELIMDKKTDQVLGEENFLCFEAVGVTAVIAPWNFPLAILTGMTVAPLVCGNPVIIKPAEQSPVSAYKLALLLLEAGFPSSSFFFLPGKGEEIGDFLVSHPKTSILSFTGSLEVGLQIIKKSYELGSPGSPIKKIVVEMGGKNPIVIDSSADLDEAVKGVIYSSFGFQGQKCSAASRLIILEDVYERFMERFLPACQSLSLKDPRDPSSDLGPLVDKQSFLRVRDVVLKREEKKLFGEIPEESPKGFFFPPQIYLVEDKDSPLMKEEFFAPIVACFKVKDFDEALRISNHTQFGLTASLYSRHPSHIERFKKEVEVGNLYVNRSSTGAMPSRHPFGGRKMSGLGSKTGGEDYLKNFLHKKVKTENIMRKGFSPELF